MNQRLPRTTLTEALMREGDRLLERVATTRGAAAADAVRTLAGEIERGDDALYRRGLYIGSMWLDVVAAALLRGGGLVIEAPWTAASGNAAARPRAAEALSAAITGLIGAVTAGARQPHMVVAVNDAASRVSTTDRAAHEALVATLLREQGAAEDAATVVYLSDYGGQAAQFVERLRDSRYGTVEQRPDGLWFTPAESWLDVLTAGSLWGPSRDELPDRGIRLNDAAGNWSEAALNAARALDRPADPRRILMVVHGWAEAPLQDQTYALLRAAELVRQDEYHEFVLGGEHHLEPAAVAAAAAFAFVAAIEGALDDRRDYGDSGRDPSWPQDYLRRHYVPRDGELADAELLRWLAPAALHHIPPRSLTTAINHGHGPWSWLDLIAAALLTDHGVLRLEEPNVAALEIIQQRVDGREPRDVAGIGPAYERLLVEVAGSAFDGCDARARALSRVIFGVIDDTFDRSLYDLNLETFVSCSGAHDVTGVLSGMWGGIRARAARTRPGGYLIGAHEIHRRQWAGFPFRGLGLRPRHVRQAYRDAGLEILDSYVNRSREEMAVIARKPADGV